MVSYSMHLTLQGKALLAALTGPYYFKKSYPGRYELEQDVRELSDRVLTSFSTEVLAMLEQFCITGSVSVADLKRSTEVMCNAMSVDNTESQNEHLWRAAELSAVIYQRFEGLRQQLKMDRGALELSIMTAYSALTAKGDNSESLAHPYAGTYPAAWSFVANTLCIFARMFDNTVADVSQGLGKEDAFNDVLTNEKKFYEYVNFLRAAPILVRESGLVATSKRVAAVGGAHPSCKYPLGYMDRGEQAFGPMSWSWSSDRSRLYSLLGGAAVHVMPKCADNGYPWLKQTIEHLTTKRLTSAELTGEKNNPKGKYRLAATLLPPFVHTAASLILDYRRFFELSSLNPTKWGENLRSVPSDWHDYFFFHSGNAGWIKPFTQSHLGHYQKSGPATCLEDWPEERELFGRVASLMRLMTSESLESFRERLALSDPFSIVQETGGVASSSMSGAACMKTLRWYGRLAEILGLNFISSKDVDQSAEDEEIADETDQELVAPNAPNSSQENSTVESALADLLPREVIEGDQMSVVLPDALDLDKYDFKDDFAVAVEDIRTTVSGVSDLFRKTSLSDYTPFKDQVTSPSDLQELEQEALKRTLKQSREQEDLSFVATFGLDKYQDDPYHSSGGGLSPLEVRRLIEQEARSAEKRSRGNKVKVADALTLEDEETLRKAQLAALRAREANEVASARSPFQYPNGYPASGAITSVSGVGFWDTCMTIILSMFDY